MKRYLAWGRAVLGAVAVAGLSACPPEGGKDAGGGEEICLVQADCEAGLFCYLGKCVTEIPRPDAAAADAWVAPDAGQRDAGRPDARRPDAARPDTGVQDAGQPDTGRPDTGPPDAGRPDTGRPDAGRPDSAQPRDAAVTDRGECYCSGRQTCDPDAGGCQEPAVCVEDRDCLAGRYCVWGGCVDTLPECRRDVDCPGGICVQEWLECRPETCGGDGDCPAAEVCRSGACVQCRDASQCQGSQECSSDGVCMESGTCLGDNDCLAPRRCVDTACQEPDCGALSAACPAGPWCDAFEPNDSIYAAVPLTPGTHLVTLCRSEDDWFTLTHAPGDGLLALATMLDPVVAGAQFELFTLENEIRRLVMGAQQDTRTLRLAKDQMPGTTHYLRLASLVGGMQRVELYVELVPGGYCTPDRWEPNDFRQEAVTMVPSATGQGDGPAITLCPGDEDWFKGTLAPGKTLDVTLLTTDGPGLALALYGGVNLTLRGLDTSLDATKVLTTYDPINFEVRVYRQDPTVGERATLLFRVRD